MKNSLLLIFFCFLINSLSHAQTDDDAKIMHFQRKLTFESLPFPGNNYSSSIFNIVYPDSLYNSGTIRVKKATFQDLKFEFDSEFKNGVYIFTSFKSNKRTQKKLLKIIKEHYDLEELSKDNNASVKKDDCEIKIMTIKKHIYLIMKDSNKVFSQ